MTVCGGTTTTLSRLTTLTGWMPRVVRLVGMGLGVNSPGGLDRRMR